MMDNDGKLDILKRKMKSITRLKIRKEKSLYEIKNIERTLCEELYTTQSDIVLLSEQLEDLKDEISVTGCRIAALELQKTSEIACFECRISYLKAHNAGFEDFFDKERNLLDIRKKRTQLKEAEAVELQRFTQRQVEEKREQHAMESAVIEQECDAIDKECAVLKKRNNAIKLKLRRKLVETEDARRDLIKQQTL